jgi:hypothetical protein
MKTLALLILIGCCGCHTLKKMAPNSWNATWYEGDQFKPGNNMLGIGESGPLPRGN